MLTHDITLRRVEDPPNARIDEAVELFASLLGDDRAMMSLTGGEPDTALRPLGRAMLCAGIHSGQYYEATEADGRLAGFLMTMPPGQDLFSTEEQRALGLTDFMGRLSDVGKEFYKNIYMTQFPAFVNKNLGPTGRRDSWYIHMIMVKREHQGKGIAKGLINLVCEKASQRGDVIALSCTTDVNAEIYQKCGLTLLGKQMIPSPWGEWPMYLLSLSTRTA